MQTCLSAYDVTAHTSAVEFKVERKEEFGGDKLYTSYEDIEADFKSEVMHVLRQIFHYTICSILLFCLYYISTWHNDNERDMFYCVLRVILIFIYRLSVGTNY